MSHVKEQSKARQVKSYWLMVWGPRLLNTVLYLRKCQISKIKKTKWPYFNIAKHSLFVGQPSVR